MNIGKRRRNLRRVRAAKAVIWIVISVLGAVAFGVLALARGETISAAWLLTAAVCTYVIGYRFYSKFLATKVFGLDPARATPAERCCSDTTLPRLPAPVPWSVQCSRHSSVSSPGRSGS